MLKLFKPDRILDRYQDLDIEELKRCGIAHIFMDIDNTLAPYYEKVADKNAIDFINELKKNGINVVLVSNNKKQRVKTFADSLNLDYEYFALKPFPFAYNRIAKRLNIRKTNVLCMGDQVLTDVIAARLANMRVYYTKPLVDKDSFSTKINRKIEKFIMRHY